LHGYDRRRALQLNKELLPMSDDKLNEAIAKAISKNTPIAGLELFLLYMRHRSWDKILWAIPLSHERNQSIDSIIEAHRDS